MITRTAATEVRLEEVQFMMNVGQGIDDRRLMPEAAESSAGTAPAPQRAQVLIIEDNRADVFLVERAVEHYKVPASLTVIEDGEQAIRHLDALDADGDAPAPTLMLLDLNLPKRPGTEVLRRLRASGRCRHIPVIVLTSSDSAEDRRMAAEYGASRYFRKPTSYDEFLKIGQIMNEVLALTSN